MRFSIFGRKPAPPKQFAARRTSAVKSQAADSADGELDAFTEAGGRGLRLEIGASGLDPCVEQAAILFAADHRTEARSVLEAALQEGNAPEACWFMLLELYELQGERQHYQAVALKYAAHFKKATPTPRPSVALVAAAAPPGGQQLSGQIVSAGADSFSYLLELGGAEVEIDASQLQRMDFVSAGILLNTMLALQRAGKRVRIHQLSHLVAALLASVGIGGIAALETKKY